MKEGSFVGVRVEQGVAGQPDARLSDIQEIRAASRERSRSLIARLFQKYHRDLGVCSIAGASAFMVTSCGRATFDTIPMKERPHAEDIADLPTFEEMRTELSEAIGPTNLEKELFPEPSQTTHEDVAESAERVSVVQVEVEQSWGISNKGMQRLIEGVLPPPWITKESIDSISIASAPIPMPKQYGIEGYASGICERGDGAGAATIRLSPETKPGMETIRLLAHEAAHANDWKRSNTLPPEKRLMLLYLVHKRVQSPDRMQFSYVESIKNEDPHKEHLLKLTEYWAELMETRLSSDVLDWRATRDDERLMRWYFRDVAKTFVPGERHEQLIEGVMREAVHERIEQELHRLPAGRTKANLIALLHRPLRDDTLARRELLTMEIAGVDLSAGHISTDPRLAGLLTPEDMKYAEALHAERDRALETWRRKEPTMSEVDAYTQARYWLDRVRFMSDYRFTLSNPAHHAALHAMKGPIDTLKRDMESLSPARRSQLEEQCHDYDFIDDVRFDIPVARPKQFTEKLKRFSDQIKQVEGKDTPL